MAPDSAAGVMSARTCRAIARVCMPVEGFLVGMFDAWVFVRFVVLGRYFVKRQEEREESWTFKGDLRSVVSFWMCQ